MSNNLLKPASAWFLRPAHLNQESFHAPIVNMPLKIPYLIQPEEECFIRQYCPVTLNHLLPDLYLTNRNRLADSNIEYYANSMQKLEKHLEQPHQCCHFESDYDANQISKFEKHLEESHREMSCTSSTESEFETEGESEFVERIENNLNYLKNDIKRTEYELSKKTLLLPNKINYPDEASDMLLPDVVLNNVRSRSVSPMLTKNFCTGCLNERNNEKNLTRNKSFSIPKTSENYRLKRLLNRKAIHHQDAHLKFPLMGKQNESYEPSNTELRAEVLPQAASQYRRELSSNICGKKVLNENNARNSCVSEDSAKNNYACSPCMHYRRSRSTSPNVRQCSSREVEETVGLVPPSPFMAQLARLRKKCLRMEEKMLLKRRQALEMERLRPPTDKWYERKDPQFHLEARKNNIYLKNEQILPLIEERRKQLYDALKT